MMFNKNVNKAALLLKNINKIITESTLVQVNQLIITEVLKITLAKLFIWFFLNRQKHR